MRAVIIYLLAVVIVLTPGVSHAWGPDGHHTVATIAADLIAGTNAETKVNALLGGLSLADAAVWADCVKSVNSTTLQYEDSGKFPECAVFETPEGKAAMVDFVRRNATNCMINTRENICHKQYHYSDVAIQRNKYDAGFVGARDDDIVAAVVAVTHVLMGDPAPAPFNIKDKAEALRLLAHYAGDIHQPLHVGAIYLDAQGNEVNPDSGTFDPATATRGANSIIVLPGGTHTLHATWDAIPPSLKMERVNSAWLAAARAVPASTGGDLDWPKQWASESVAEANAAFSGLTVDRFENGHWAVTLSSGYSPTMSSIKKKQLTRAGAHLAQLLREIFVSSPVDRRAPLPTPVAEVVAQVSAAQARDSQLSALHAAEEPLVARDVVALSDTETVRLTDSNTGAVLAKPTLTAERIGTAATQVVLPASLWLKVSAHPAEVAYALPTRFTALTVQGNQPVSFNIVLNVLEGLHYDAAHRKFAGHLAMALINSLNHGDTSKLTHEVPVLVGAEGAEISPVNLRFTFLGVPQEVLLSVPTPIDPYVVQVITALNRGLDSVVVPIHRPDIEVRPVNNVIRGLGLEETTVLIRIAGAQGQKGQVVALQTTRGLIVPSPLILDDSGTGVAKLRSAGIGGAQITATDPPFHAGQSLVEFIWPIAFVLATVIGGIVGALLRKDARQRPLGSLLVGILAATVVCVSHAVGVSTQIWGTPSGGAGEGLFFAIAAIAGFLGREAITKLVSSK
jgi:hypothetical protein